MEENKRDPLPAHFDTLEEAANFWDEHSAADYWDEMVEMDAEFAIQEQLFFVPVTNAVYRQVKAKAEGEGRPLPDVVNDLLLRELA